MATITWTRVGARSAVGYATAIADTGGDGVLLEGVAGIGVFVEADSGQTIASKITLAAEVQDVYTERWHRAPDLDMLNLSGITGSRGQYLGGIQVYAPVGRLRYTWASGTVSSGGLSIRLVCAELATGAKL